MRNIFCVPSPFAWDTELWSCPRTEGSLVVQEAARHILSSNIDLERCRLASRAESFENRARNKREALRGESQQRMLGDGN